LEGKTDSGNVFELVLSDDQDVEGTAPVMNAVESESSCLGDLLLTQPM
jgi:hypothetical protein